MRLAHCLVAVALLVLGLVTVGSAREDAPRPLSEAGVLKLVGLELGDSATVALLEKAGVTFQVDDAVIERLKKGGASAAVVAAVRKAGGGGAAVSYENLLDLLKRGREEA